MRYPENLSSREHEYILVPLIKNVIFPHTRFSLIIHRARAVAGILSAQANTHQVVMVRQFDPLIEQLRPDDIPMIGTLVKIISVQQQENMHILVEGIRRVRIDSWLQEDPFYAVSCTPIVETSTKPQHLTEALLRHANELFERYIQLEQKSSGQDLSGIERIQSTGKLADKLAALLPSDTRQQQDILEVLDPDVRLETVCVALGNEIEILDLEHRLQQRVHETVSRRQQEYLISQRVAAIDKMLGDDIISEAEELRQRLQQKQLPEVVTERVYKEIKKLERMPQNSAEVHVVRNYIDWILALPWNERVRDSLDIHTVKKVLNHQHFGMTRVKERIVDYLAIRQLQEQQAQKSPISIRESSGSHVPFGRSVKRGQILCLLGPPGVGKTSIGESIAFAMGRPFIRISLGGIHDEAEIRGHRRTYVGALPGRIINAMKSAGARNPVFLLDEIDKMTSDYRGDPASAMLEVLDPGQNAAFTDHFLEIPYDLSEVFFICTGNSRIGIPPALADRMEIIDIPGYTEDEKVSIAKHHLWPKLTKISGLEEQPISLSENILHWIIMGYTHEAGVRSLERRLELLCSKIARRVLEEPGKKIRLTRKMIEEYLGVPRFLNSLRPETDQVGVAIGLAWTEAGGTLLPIEVAVMPGRGEVNLTGQQGQIMQESARTALSYVRTRAMSLNLSATFVSEIDLHLHLPEGAVPKDGPSAGITIAAAIISALTHRPVRSDTAMTGEITLFGRVLAIGGLRDKVLAAHRAGIKRIVVPEANRQDIDEIPKRVQDALQFIFVRTMPEVEREVLREHAVPGDFSFLLQMNPEDGLKNPTFLVPDH